MKFKLSIIGFLVAMAIPLMMSVPTHSSEYSIRDYRSDMAGILRKDQALAATDFTLWPEVAIATRKLALSQSIKFANDAIDEVFRSAPSRKLYSHVWSVLPSASILGLGEHWYRSELDVFPEGTAHRLIRQNLLNFVKSEPTDPFIDFAYYALGDFQKGLTTSTLWPCTGCSNQTGVRPSAS